MKGPIIFLRFLHDNGHGLQDWFKGADERDDLAEHIRCKRAQHISYSIGIAMEVMA